MTYRRPAPAATGSYRSNATGGTDGGGGQSGPTGTLTPPEPQELHKRREFARCMRENGVEDFPDPDAHGIFQYYGDDPDLKVTGEKCDDLQPADQDPR